MINYYALASGFLSGKYRTPADAGKSSRGADIVKTYLNERGHRILNALDDVAAKARYQCSHRIVSLADGATFSYRTYCQRHQLNN